MYKLQFVYLWQGAIPSGSCTPTYPSGSLKRNSKMQRRVDGSVAQTDDGSANVVLSSVTTVDEDVAPTLSESITSIFNSLNADVCGNGNSSKSTSEQSGNSLAVSKKNSNLQV